MKYLARVAKLHEAALAAGLPGVLPDGYYIEGRPHVGHHLFYRLPHPAKDAHIPSSSAQAAVAWWLREWCNKHDPEYAHFNRDSDIQWAESIVASKAPT